MTSSQGAQLTVRLAMPFARRHACAALHSIRQPVMQLASPMIRQTRRGTPPVRRSFLLSLTARFLRTASFQQPLLPQPDLLHDAVAGPARGVLKHRP